MPFQRPPGIGLPDTPVMMHDLNLDEMMAPRYATPVQPTGKLKVQLQFGEKALHVIIIEVKYTFKLETYLRSLTCADPDGGQGVRPHLKNHKNIGSLSNTGLEPLKKSQSNQLR